MELGDGTRQPENDVDRVSLIFYMLVSSSCPSDAENNASEFERAPVVRAGEITNRRCATPSLTREKACLLLELFDADRRPVCNASQSLPQKYSHGEGMSTPRVQLFISTVHQAPCAWSVARSRPVKKALQVVLLYEFCLHLYRYRIVVRNEPTVTSMTERCA